MEFDILANEVFIFNEGTNGAYVHMRSIWLISIRC